MAFCTAIDLNFKLDATRLRVCFQPPASKEEEGTLWVPEHGIIGLTLFLGPAYGRYRWHCYVIRAGRKEERGVVLPFATPGVEVLYHSSTKRQAAFFLATIEAFRNSDLDSSQLNPDYYRQLRHHLHLPQRFWRVGLA